MIGKNPTPTPTSADDTVPGCTNEMPESPERWRVVLHANNPDARKVGEVGRA